MNKLIDLTLKFQGIIGTLLGVVATLITTELIKRSGKVYLYFNEWKGNFYGTQDITYGIIEDIKNIGKADSYHYSFKLQIYNSSDSFKILRDIKIQYKLKCRVVDNIPFDSNKTEYMAHFPITQDLSIINLPPKQILEFNISGVVYDDNVVDFLEDFKIYFTASDHKNRKIKKLIKSC